MDSVSANFSPEEQKPIFTLASEPNPTTTTDSYAFADTRNTAPNQGGLSSMTPMMGGLEGNELLNMLSQQEPRVADSAPSVAEMEELLSNIRLSGSDVFTDDILMYFISNLHSDFPLCPENICVANTKETKLV